MQPRYILNQSTIIVFGYFHFHMGIQPKKYFTSWLKEIRRTKSKSSYIQYQYYRKRKQKLDF